MFYKDVTGWCVEIRLGQGTEQGEHGSDEAIATLQAIDDGGSDQGGGGGEKWSDAGCVTKMESMDFSSDLR